MFAKHISSCWADSVSVKSSSSNQAFQYTPILSVVIKHCSIYRVHSSCNAKLVLTKLMVIVFTEFSHGEQLIQFMSSCTISTESPVKIEFKTTLKWLVWTKLLLLPNAWWCQGMRVSVNYHNFTKSVFRNQVSSCGPTL